MNGGMKNILGERLKNFKRIVGIAVLLLFIMLVTTMLNPRFLNAYNIRNILRWTGLFGILSLGTAFVIITGGIDLSIGSLVGLTGSLSAYLIAQANVPVVLTLLIVIGFSVLIGLFHGLLITKIRLQPFVVTLCGLFLYRGLARYLMDDRTQGYGTTFPGIRQLTQARFPSSFWPEGSTPPAFIQNWSIPSPFLILIGFAILLAILLNKSVYGQHLKATGKNESAARFSGIHTHRVIIIAYILSSAFAGLGGIFFSLDLNSVQPATMGSMYELYAIAGCVVGGVSLRGGEGQIVGVLLGAAIVRVLYNAINVAGVATQLESVVLGLVILVGVSVDEIIRMVAAKRRVRESLAAANVKRNEQLQDTSRA